MGHSDGWVDVGRPSDEFRFGFPREGTVKDWLAVDERDSRESGPAPCMRWETFVSV
jgi:hypothetical protein